MRKWWQNFHFWVNSLFKTDIEKRAAHTWPKNLQWQLWCSLGGLGTDQSQARTDGEREWRREMKGRGANSLLHNLTSSVNIAQTHTLVWLHTHPPHFILNRTQHLSLTTPKPLLQDKTIESSKHNFCVYVYMGSRNLKALVKILKFSIF